MYSTHPRRKPRIEGLISNYSNSKPKMGLIPVLLLSLLACLALAEVQVHTTDGIIAGEKSLLSDVVYFKGIPFGQPPLGSLRFLPPQPVAPWSGVLKTKEFKPDWCVHLVSFDQNLSHFLF